MSASIPKNLKIFIRGQTQVHRTVCGQKQMVFVKKAFATDADKPKTHETAERWAKGQGYRWDPDLKRNVPTNNTYEVVERPNEPFTGLTIYNIEVRSEGGRAYKVQTKEGWAFDCREDTILDTIMEDGIDAGGHMNGEFIWCKDGSQMKITRVGSALCQEAQKHMKRVKKGPIKKKDLVYGGIYENTRGDTVVYLGEKHGKMCFALIWHYCSKGDWLESFKKETREEIERYHRDLKTWSKNPNKLQQTSVWSRWSHNPDNRYKPRDPRHYHEELKKSHAYTDKIGQLTEAEVEELIFPEGNNGN